jgi:hypothetical protein
MLGLQHSTLPSWGLYQKNPSASCYGDDGAITPEDPFWKAFWRAITTMAGPEIDLGRAFRYLSNVAHESWRHGDLQYAK